MKGFGVYIVIVLGLLMGFSYVVSQSRQVTELTFSNVYQLFEQEQVRTCLVESNVMYLHLQDGQIVSWDAGDYYALAEYHLHDLIHQQIENGTLIFNYKSQQIPWWAQFIPYLILAALLIAFWIFMMNKQTGGGGGPMQFGKARARLAQDDKRKVTFDDVAGADEEKAELQEIVEFLKNPQKFVQIGARIPKGVLLVGPPGTGKTLIARAVAGEAGVPFLSISGSDFVELYVGVGASRVRDLFEQAKKNSPAIVFIDEIDAVGRQRGAGLGGGHDEREQTLNQLLVEMDGFGANEGVIVIAATNRKDILDNALLRPGRFDRQVYVGVPDIKGREQILNVHAKNKQFDPDVSFDSIAKGTVGMTGADLENLLNEAALLAARRNKKLITNDEIEEALLKVEMGPEKKSKVISDKKKRIVAYHEAGHAVARQAVGTLDPIHYITIIPRGGAGGFTMWRPEEEAGLESRTYFLDTLVGTLGGRVAEQIVFQEITTGASGDIQSATAMARAMVVNYGFSDKIGAVDYGDSGEVFIGRDFGATHHYSESKAAEIDDEVHRIISEAYTRCENLLTENREKLNAVAEYLIRNETMDGDTFLQIFNGEDVPDRMSSEEVLKAELAEKDVEQRDFSASLSKGEKRFSNDIPENPIK